MNEPIIYITNDDGINSPGLYALIEAVSDLGEIIVLAPSGQQTAMGRGISGDINQAFVPQYFKVNGKNIAAYHMDCSPAHVIAHGINVFGNSKRPNLLISGINYGENLGTNITHSGTIGAAIEAADNGIPALAVSLQTHIDNHKTYGKLDWSTAAYFARLFTKKLLDKKLPFDVDILKVDIPEDATTDTPIKYTKVSRNPHYRVILDSPDQASKINDGRLVVKNVSNKTEPDSDIYAVIVEKVVSVSPISIDLTSRINLNDLEDLLEST